MTSSSIISMVSGSRTRRPVGCSHTISTRYVPAVGPRSAGCRRPRPRFHQRCRRRPRTRRGCGRRPEGPRVLGPRGGNPYRVRPLAEGDRRPPGRGRRTDFRSRLCHTRPGPLGRRTPRRPGGLGSAWVRPDPPLGRGELPGGSAVLTWPTGTKVYVCRSPTLRPAAPLWPARRPGCDMVRSTLRPEVLAQRPGAIPITAAYLSPDLRYARDWVRRTRRLRVQSSARAGCDLPRNPADRNDHPRGG